MSKIIFIAFIVLGLVACKEHSENQQLFDRIYSLIDDGEYKMAQEYFNNHKLEIRTPLTKADSMYCIFLNEFMDMLNAEEDLTQLFKFIDTTSVENLIGYYAKTSDTEKLAYSLLLKSQKLYLMARHNDGIYYLKQSERIINKLNNTELKYYLANLKLCYSTNNLNLKAAIPLIDSVGKYVHNQRQREDLYLNKAFFFAADNKFDSAKIYISRCQPDTTNYAYLSKYAWIFADDEPEKCERFARKVLTDKPKSADTDYAKLSILKILFLRNQTAEAEEYFKNNRFFLSYPNVICYESFYNYYKKIGDYEKATKSADIVIEVKNALINWANNYKVSQNSEKYDFQLELLENQNRFQRWVIIFVCLVALITILAAVQRRRYEREMSVNRQILKESRDKIDELQALEKSTENDKEIQRLQKKILEIESRYAEIYRDGKILYEQIFLSGGNSSQWNKKDYEKFIEYYKTLNLSLITQIEDDYNGLNPRQMFYKILSVQGFDKAAIMRTMGIQEDVTFRALKSKVEGMKRKG
ncbi:MAG: hypothetical protein II956_11090 [Bacteroidales bacterium]|nr:hypothetical protein [Bacteroidales bacterium]